MGKDRRKKDTVRKQANESDSVPKGQREPRVRAQQREIPKNTDIAVKEKAAENTPPTEEETKKTEPINTEELFANLKRETDEIKALTTKKFAKRQIFSNWERYEEPPPQPQYEVEIQGADFESLLEAPSSGGGYFQFKSERSWDANVSALSGELFSLDVDLLADGLATIPLYKKLDLPNSLFLSDEKESMDCYARTALKQYESTKKNVKTRDKKKVPNQLLEIIKESSPGPTDKNPTEDKTLLNFDIDEPEIQNEVDENVNEKESFNNFYINDKPEITENKSFRQTPPPSPKVNEVLPEERPSTVLKSSNKIQTEQFDEASIPSRKNRKETLAARDNKKDNLLSKEIKNQFMEEVKETRKESTPPKEIKREQFTAMRDIKKERTPPKEVKREEVTPIRDVDKESTPPKEIKREQFTAMRDIKKERTPLKEVKREEVTPIRDIDKDSTPPKEIKREQVTPMRHIKKERMPPKEVKQEEITPIRDIKKERTPPQEITADIPEQAEHVLNVDSSENMVQEPVIPLGQRTSRRKAKGQSQVSESQSKAQVLVTQSETNISESQKSQNKKKLQFIESQEKSQPPEDQNKNLVTESKNKSEEFESQQKFQISDNQVKAQQSKSKPQLKQTKLQPADDDLDFLLSLKKPVRESQLSGLQPSQVAKPSIEEDDTSGPDSNLMLVAPQKQTEDLEDWLDSMLDD